MKYTDDELFHIATAMQVYGGSFVQCIGQAIKCGDPINKARVVKAFDDYVDEYYKRFVRTGL